MQYAAWYDALSDEQQAAYGALLNARRCVACHLEAMPGLFGGKPVEVLPDDHFGAASAPKPKPKKKAKE